MSHPPAKLQGTLWSVPVNQLDTKINRVYIVHQVLAFGTMDDLRWLFRTYSKKTLKHVFIHTPIKIYTRPAFHFAKLLLDCRDEEAPLYRYDRSTPRCAK